MQSRKSSHSHLHRGSVRYCPSLRSHWVWEGARTTSPQTCTGDSGVALVLPSQEPLNSPAVLLLAGAAGDKQPARIMLLVGTPCVSLPSRCPEHSPPSPRHPATGSTGRSGSLLHGATKGCSRSPSALTSFQGFLNCWFRWLPLHPCQGFPAQSQLLLHAL